MNRRALTIALIGAAIAATPYATADVEIVRADPIPRLSGSWCDIRLGGAITAADAAVLAASDCVRANIFVHDSPGGDINAAMAIGHWARERDAWVSIVTDAYCHSSCALVFIGGVERSSFGEIGLHRPYLAGAPRSNAEVGKLVSRMLDQIRDYVDEMGIAPEFASVMLNTSPASMRVYRTDEIYELLGRTDPLYDELQVAEVARSYGTTTDEYRRRRAEAERSCAASRLGFPRYMDAGSEELAAYSAARHECQQAIYWGLSQSVYRDRYNDAVERCSAGEPTPDEVQECGIRVMQGLD